MKQTMSDAKAIKISKLIDYHRERQNLRLSSGEITTELSTDIELIKDHKGNLGAQSATKAEQQFLRQFERIENDKNLIDLHSKTNLSSQFGLNNHT